MGGIPSVVAGNSWRRISSVVDARRKPIEADASRSVVLEGIGLHFQPNCIVLKRWPHKEGSGEAARRTMGVRCLIGSRDGQVRAYDASSELEASSTGREGLAVRYSLEAHTGLVNQVSMSDDSSKGASCGADGLLAVWDLNHRTKDWSVQPKDCANTACCELSGDGKWVISGGSDKQLHLWDAANGTRVCTFGKQKRKTLAEMEEVAIHIQVEIRKREALLPVGVGLHSDLIKCCSFDKLTPYIRVVSGSWDKTLLLWDIETHVATMHLKGHTGRVSACCLSGEPNLCASGSLDNTCRIWDLRSGEAAAVLEGHKAGITTCSLSVYPTHEPLLWTGSRDGELRVWDMRTMQPREVLHAHYDSVLSTSLTQDGRTGASIGLNDDVRIWKAREFVEYDIVMYPGASGGDGAHTIRVSIDPKDDLSRAKRHLQFKTLERVAGHEEKFLLSDETFRNQSWRNQQWTATVEGRKKLLGDDEMKWEDYEIPLGSVITYVPKSQMP